MLSTKSSIRTQHVFQEGNKEPINGIRGVQLLLGILLGARDVLKEDQDRPCLADILSPKVSTVPYPGDKPAVAETLTPSLCVSFLTTPSCGDRMTVSIFIDSML